MAALPLTLPFSLGQRDRALLPHRLPFNLGGDPVLLESAQALDVRCIAVTFTAPPPAAVSPFEPNDVLNVTSWTVLRGDTGERIGLLSVERVSARTFELHLSAPMGFLAIHTVSYVLAPGSVSFQGLVSAAEV
jgi:hypothetical protein